MAGEHPWEGERRGAGGAPRFQPGPWVPPQPRLEVLCPWLGRKGRFGGVGDLRWPGSMPNASGPLYQLFSHPNRHPKSPFFSSKPEAFGDLCPAPDHTIPPRSVLFPPAWQCPSTVTPSLRPGPPQGQGWGHPMAPCLGSVLGEKRVSGASNNHLLCSCSLLEAETIGVCILHCLI